MADKKNIVEQYYDGLFERKWQADANARAMVSAMKQMEEEKKRKEEIANYWEHRAERKEQKRQAKEEKKRQSEEAKWASAHNILEGQKSEVEKWEEEHKDKVEHDPISYHVINSYMNLFLTGAKFTAKGLEITAYVDMSSSDAEPTAEIFTLIADMDGDDASINYLGKDIVIKKDELQALLARNPRLHTGVGIRKGSVTDSEPSVGESQTVSGSLKLNHTDGQYLLTMRDYLKENNKLYVTTAVEKVRSRRRKEEFTLNDHIKGMIYALLSSEAEWKNIEPKLPEIDKIFHDYDAEYIKGENPEKFVEAIYSLSCGNRATKRQMAALKGNIEVFENLASGYGSMDTFIRCYMEGRDFTDIVNFFANQENSYKLKMMGPALVSEYLRNVGVDGVKPDRHLCRFLGSDRMGDPSMQSPATTDEVFAQVDVLAEKTGLYKVEIDNIIWSFCADGFGEVCTAEPHCGRCPIRDLCAYR